MDWPTRRVAILGGMGPAAGAEFTRLFVSACERWLRAHGRPVRDQAYPEHVLLQLPFADRTAALVAGETSELSAGLAGALEALCRMDVAAVAMACNTVHAWHAELQARCPSLELLHVGQLVVDAVERLGLNRVGLLATQGTYAAGIYDGALRRSGHPCALPNADERDLLMQGIYDGVKAGNLPLARRLFAQAAASFCERESVRTLILGCTEIPLALRAADLHDPRLVLLDPGELLARALADRAYGCAG
jgi:aspartate racemase